MTKRPYAITPFIPGFCVLVLAAHIAVDASAGAIVAGTGQPPLMDRQKEIALALSACPLLVAIDAAVYVREKSGYVKVRDSENGFTAIVQPSLLTSQEPQCMDEEGTRTLLPRMLKVAELRAQGKSPEEIKRFVADAFARGEFQPPARPGIDYMLSTENLGPNDKGTIVSIQPHLRFYGPYLTNAELGSDGNVSGLAFVAGEGTPHALIIVPLGRHAGPGHELSDQRSGDPK
jgi:hypothetical protein